MRGQSLSYHSKQGEGIGGNHDLPLVLEAGAFVLEGACVEEAGAF